MRLKLDRKWTEQLLAWPESGMGYQLVDVKMSDGRELRRAVVLNAEWLELPGNLAGTEISDLRVHKNPSDDLPTHGR